MQNQGIIFLWTIVIGAVLGLIFDMFRVIRRKGKTKDLVVYLQDIVFWIIVTIVIIVSTFLINDGDLRGYMLFGYVLGGVFYLLLLSNVIRKIFSAIFDVIENILMRFFDTIKSLFKKICFFHKNTKKIEK